VDTLETFFVDEGAGTLFHSYFGQGITLEQCLALIIFKHSVLESVYLVDCLGGWVVDLGNFCGLGDAHSLKVDQLDQMKTSIIIYELVLFCHFCLVN
jgi:hypothetical protein